MCNTIPNQPLFHTEIFYSNRVKLDGTYGQLGHSLNNSEVLPRKILDFGSVILQVACGRSHTLCLTDKNKLYSFGLAASGQLGIGDTGNRNSPVLVSLTKFLETKTRVCIYLICVVYMSRSNSCKVLFILFIAEVISASF